MSYEQKQNNLVGVGIRKFVADVITEQEIVTRDDIETYVQDELDKVLDDRVQNILEHRMKISVEVN